MTIPTEEQSLAAAISKKMANAKTDAELKAVLDSCDEYELSFLEATIGNKIMSNFERLVQFAALHITTDKKAAYAEYIFALLDMGHGLQRTVDIASKHWPEAADAPPIAQA
jgi:hypothetical protein